MGSASADTPYPDGHSDGGDPKRATRKGARAGPASGAEGGCPDCSDGLIALVELPATRQSALMAACSWRVAETRKGLIYMAGTVFGGCGSAGRGAAPGAPKPAPAFAGCILCVCVCARTCVCVLRGQVSKQREGEGEREGQGEKLARGRARARAPRGQVSKLKSTFADGLLAQTNSRERERARAYVAGVDAQEHLHRRPAGADQLERESARACVRGRCRSSRAPSPTACWRRSTRARAGSTRGSAWPRPPRAASAASTPTSRRPPPRSPRARAAPRLGGGRGGGGRKLGWAGVGVVRRKENSGVGASMM